MEKNMEAATKLLESFRLLVSTNPYVSVVVLVVLAVLGLGYFYKRRIKTPDAQPTQKSPSPNLTTVSHGSKNVTIGIAHGNISITPEKEQSKSPPDIVIVRQEIVEETSGAGLRSRLRVTLKNNGDRSAVLLHGILKVKAKATVIDCNDRRFSLDFSSWTYDVDIETGGEFVGRHHLIPNEVETFDVLIGREKGGPHLTVYRTDAEFHFDEPLTPLVIRDLYVKIAGPSTIKGSFSPGTTEKQWCNCMIKNIDNFHAIGYDFTQHLDEKTMAMIDKYRGRHTPNI